MLHGEEVHQFIRMVREAHMNVLARIFFDEAKFLRCAEKSPQHVNLERHGVNLVALGVEILQIKAYLVVAKGKGVGIFFHAP